VSAVLLPPLISEMAVKKPGGPHSNSKNWKEKVKKESLGPNQNKKREKRQKNCERSYCDDHTAKNEPN
jgi:hypothetical protein